MMPVLINSTPRQTLSLAVVLGLVGDQLVWGAGLTGPVLLIWLSMLVLVAAWLARYNNWCRQLLLWGGVAVLAAAMRLLLTLPIVDLAMLAIMVAAAAQILLRTAGFSFRQADAWQQVLAHLAVPLQTLLGGFPVLGRLEFKPAPAHPAIYAGLRGLLFASPLLLAFTLLFSAADITFENYLTQLPALFLPTMLQHLLLVLLISWLALGLLASAWQPRTARASPVMASRLGATETLVMMGLLTLLFISFASLQLSHLLRDATGIALTTGLSTAEYARYGFFQLVWIAALALLMLQVLSACIDNQRLFAGFGAVLLLCVLIVLASAVQRMQFYIQSFGLSIDRVVASTVMLWLAASLLLFAATMLRNRPEGFASGTVSLGIAICFGLALVNPAALVARINIDRSLNQQQILDLGYLIQLGPDATPTLLEYWPQLAHDTQCGVANDLVRKWLTNDNTNVQQMQDWRHWNLANYRALTVVQAHRQQLLAACQ